MAIQHLRKFFWVVDEERGRTHRSCTLRYAERTHTVYVVADDLVRRLSREVLEDRSSKDHRQVGI